MEVSLCAALSSTTDTSTGNYDESFMIVTLLLLLLLLLFCFFANVFYDDKFTFGHYNFSMKLFNLNWRYARNSGYSETE